MSDKYPSQYDRMTKQPVPTLLLQLSIPTIISMMVTNIYNMADTAFVGQLGTSASGAVGVVFGFMSILQAIGFMFGQGSGSNISRMLGAKKTDEATKFACTGIFWSFAFGVIIALCCFFMLDSLCFYLGSTETIAPYAKIYISYILLAAPAMTASFTMNNILRYEGRANLGMIGMLTGAVLNIALDPFFMFTLNTGIAGAGLATCISQYISFGILISMFFRNKTQSKLLISREHSNPSLIFEICAMGFPSLLRQGLNSVSTIFLNSEAGVYGDSAVAAMSVTTRIVFFVFSIAIGVGQGFQPIGGFNYGAKNYKRLKKAFWTTMLVSEIAMLIVLALVYFNSGDLIRIFRDDDEVVSIGLRALRLQLLTIVFIPPCMCTEMLFQCSGKKLGAIILSCMRSGILFIPTLITLSDLRGLSGIQEAQPLAYVLSIIPAAIMGYYYFKKLPKDDECS